MKLNLLSCLSIAFLLGSCSSSNKIIQKKSAPEEFANNLMVAHRGAFKMNRLPENSIASLKHAIELKCTGSEFDVQMTSDDSLIINHDPHYNSLEIEKTDYAALIKTPLSNGEKLPTLREYLLAGLANNNSTRLVLEIKPSVISKERGKRVAERVVQLVHVLNATSKTVYISFDYDILKKIKEIDAKASTQYLNGEKSPEELKADGIDGADYHFSVFKKHPEWIESAKKNNIILNAWTVNEAADMDWLLANGFNFITTNEPELLAERIKLAPTTGNWKLIWHDEFNYTGLPNPEKWSYDTGGDGWGNNELQYYTQADTTNAMVRNGFLIISAKKEKRANNTYTSARLTTKNKGDWTYGRVEVRSKLPSGKGTWPAIWMLPTNWGYGSWPASGEIDIMENVGFNPDTVFSSVHTKSFNHVIGTQKTKGFYVPDADKNFHIYAIEWDKEKIDFFIDDIKFFTFNNSHNGFSEWPFDKKFHLLLNIAIGGNWGGMHGIDGDLNIATMVVDYVRVFQK